MLYFRLSEWPLPVEIPKAEKPIDDGHANRIFQFISDPMLLAEEDVARSPRLGFDVSCR